MNKIKKIIGFGQMLFIGLGAFGVSAGAYMITNENIDKIMSTYVLCAFGIIILISWKYGESIKETIEVWEKYNKKPRKGGTRMIIVDSQDNKEGADRGVKNTVGMRQSSTSRFLSKHCVRTIYEHHDNIGQGFVIEQRILVLDISSLNDCGFGASVACVVIVVSKGPEVYTTKC